MTDGDDELMLNLFSGGGRSFSKKEKVSKEVRVKQRRQERRDAEKLVEEIKSGKTKPETRDVAPKPRKVAPVKGAEKSPKGKLHKRKRDADAADDDKDSAAKRFKSTLFYNNPEIPKLASEPVEAFTETVFSGDDFGQFGLHDHMVSNLASVLGVTEATSVQKRTIPEMLAGRDVLVKSQTGSGKTLAYGIPIIQYLHSMRPKVQRSDGVLTIVIVPTRELALQSFAAFQKLVKPYTWIVPGCLMGGEKKKSEKARLRKGLNVLISTPGRLVDHLENTKSLELGRVEWLVIDEADRLLDMGFEKDVSQVISALKERGSKDRKTALLSATLSSGVERLAGMTMNSPVKIDITADDDKKKSSATHGASSTDKASAEKFALPENLKHHCVLVPSKLKLVSLAAFILWKCKMADKRSKMLVFTSTQDSVDFLFRLFTNTLFEDDDDDEEANESDLLYRLHGDMPQKERTKVFHSFRKAESGVLFCTDVAARGLDLPSVRWIVQYDSPGGSTDYIHRVGRTARIGHRGNALIYLTPAEEGYSRILTDSGVNLIEVQMNHILQTLLKERNKLSYLWDDSIPPNTIQEAASLLQLRFTEHVRSDKASRTMARKAYQSYIGAYTAYPTTVKHIFHVKNLHLGHVATSFGLQEAPTQIGSIVGVHSTKTKGGYAHGKKKSSTHRRGSLAASVHSSNASEFSSGL